MSKTATWAPSFANRSAVARPMPLTPKIYIHGIARNIKIYKFKYKIDND